jgi:hypothetical protein
LSPQQLSEIAAALDLAETPARNNGDFGEQYATIISASVSALSADVQARLSSINGHMRAFDEEQIRMSRVGS